MVTAATEMGPGFRSDMELSRLFRERAEIVGRRRALMAEFDTLGAQLDALNLKLQSRLRSSGTQGVEP